jgi:cell division septation protein DedD
MHQEFDPRDLEPALPQAEERRRRFRLGPAILVILALGGFTAITWYAYEAGQRQVNVASMPLIKADSGPTKVRPDDPGGIAVPNQDALVLNDPGSTPNRAAGGIEKLLPPAEAPLPKPAPVAGAPALPASPPPPAIGPAPSRPSPAEAPAPRASVEAQSAPGTMPAPQPIVAPPAPTQNQTASLPTAAPPAKPAVTPVRPAAAGQGGWRIQLAAVKTEQAAAAEWARIERANPELAALSMSTTRVDLGDKGIFYRIQAGPLSDSAAAERLCAELKQRKQGCIVVKP